VTTTHINVIRCQVLTTRQFVACGAALEPEDIEAHMRSHFRREHLPRMTPREYAQSRYIATVAED
jgi:hypothetical protein